MMMSCCNYRSSMQTPVPGTSPPPLPSSTTAATDVPLVAIIVPAVGGGVILLVLVLCICMCICCVCKRTRNKNKAFNPSVSEKLPSEVGSPVYRTLTPPEIHSNLDKKEVSGKKSNNAKDLMVLNFLHNHRSFRCKLMLPTPQM